MSDVQHSEHQDPDGALLFDLLRRSGSSGRDAHLLIKLLEKMASAKLIHRFETKLEALNAQIAALRAEITTKFDAQKAALRTEITTKFDAQKAEVTAKLDAQKAEMTAKFDAQQNQLTTLMQMTDRQFRLTKWLIGIGFSVISAIGVIAGIYFYLEQATRL